MNAKAFLICPVRGHSREETEQVVRKLEGEGWQVHWPPRDTDQDDITGYRICQQNRGAIKDADIVFVVWDGKSKGCLFDAGMAFALKKQIRVIQVPQLTEGKSFQNMMKHWEGET